MRVMGLIKVTVYIGGRVTFESYRYSFGCVLYPRLTDELQRTYIKL